MQVSVENIGGLERKLTVTIPADTLDAQVGERLARMSREVRLKGFRPGKVPRAVIEKRYGDQVRGEALSDLIGSSFRDAVAQEKLRPVAAPAINTSGMPEAGEIAYTATFEVMPELPAVAVADLSITRTVAEVSEADVDHMIETLRLQRRDYVQVHRPAQEGDMVLFEYAAQTSDGRYPETGVDRAGVVLGSGQFNADVEQALQGHAADAEIEVETTFPQGFRIESLSGKLAKLSVRVIRVQEPQLPEVDAAFAKTFGINEGGVEVFRKEVRGNLERELQAALMASLKNEVASQLAAAHADIVVPKAMIEVEARNLARVPAGTLMPSEQLEQWAPQARSRSIAGLMFGELARSNNMQVDEQRVAKALATLASTYEEPEQVIELYRADPKLMSGLRNRVLEDQVAEWVAEHAKVEDKSLSFDEVIRPGAQA